MLTAAALSALFAGPALAAGVQSVEAGDGAVVLRFDDAVPRAQLFALAGPDRIAIDVDEAEPGRMLAGSGAIQAIRQGRLSAGRARIVLDLARPLGITGARFSDDGRTLTIDTSPTGPGLAVGGIAGRRTVLSPTAAAARPPKRNYTVSVALGRPRPAAGLPKIYGSGTPGLPLVVIDAGHGGHDPGALNTVANKREKDITLAIARATRDALVATGRVRVALTREDDSFIVLQDRYAIARRLNADLFISIHADAALNEEASGATIYTLSEVASDREAQRLAARENKADIINGVNLGDAGSDVSSILIDLAQRETMNASADFARTLIRTSGDDLRMRAQSHKFASFVVLKAPDTPSVLIETGYITNKDDVAMLASRDGQRRIAQGVAGAVRLHFARRLAAR